MHKSEFKHSVYDFRRPFIDKYNFNLLIEFIRRTINPEPVIASKCAYLDFSYYDDRFIHTQSQYIDNLYSIDEVNICTNPDILKSLYKSAIPEIALAEADPSKKDVFINAVNEFVEEQKEILVNEYKENSCFYKAMIEYIAQRYKE